jgi:RNA polymerase-binding protein DksA
LSYTPVEIRHVRLKRGLLGYRRKHVDRRLGARESSQAPARPRPILASSDVSTIDTDRFRVRLEDERRRVLDAIENIHAENPGSIADETEELTFQDNHLGDVATATFDREMASTLEENSTHVLSEIDAALARIEDGTFGICQRCGNQIVEERLHALPWATLCIDCKRKQERG